MHNYLKISHYLQGIFKLLSILNFIFIIVLWIFIDNKNFSYFLSFVQSNLSVFVTPNETINFFTIQHSMFSKSVGFAASFVSSAPYIFGYYALHKLFGNYANGKIFITENVSIYKRLGRVLFVNGLLCIPLHDSLMVLAATINNIPGKRMLSIGFGNPNLEAILSGFVVMVIAWAMQQANDLNHEQQLTV